jgi:hypothetical protein
MKIRVCSCLVLAVLLAGTCGGAFAADPQPNTTPASSPLAPQTVAEILATQHALRERLDKRDGAYAHLDATATRKVVQAQDRIFAMLVGVTSLDQLDPARKGDLSSALDEIKAVLAAGDDNPVLCRNEPKVGSHMTKRRCGPSRSR